MNLAWIAKQFTVEPKDLEVLDDPEGQVIGKGGRVFMALQDDRPVGCVALLKMPDGGFEVAKMTVAEEMRGSGLGRKLLQACLEAGKAAGAPRLYLETNDSLGPALGLYRAMGFRDMASQPTAYARCNVWMERPLD